MENQLDKSPNEEGPLELTRDMVERAREAGVNVPAIIEKLRGAITCRTNKANTHRDVLFNYETVFDIMKSIQLEDDIVVEVGDDEFSGFSAPLILDQRGVHVSGSRPGEEPPILAVLHFLYEPDRIICNLISELTSAAEHNKNKIKQLENALLLVKNVSGNAEKKGLSQSAQTVP